MLPELGRLGPLTVRTYALLFNLALLGGLGWLAWRAYKVGQRPESWFDAGLAAVLAGLIGARLEHVAVYWAYYADHLGQSLQIWRGGLGWHGGLIGGYLGLLLFCRWRALRPGALTAALAPALMLGAALIYLGCLSTACGHGREVASLAGYPPFIAAEAPDLYGIRAPRLLSPLYGVMWSLLGLGLVIGLRAALPEGATAWLAAAWIGLGAFLIGFTRGDAIPMWGPLRLDQYLDALMVLLSLAGLARSLQVDQRARRQASRERSRILGAVDAE